jgi:hypothetical protein
LQVEQYVEAAKRKSDLERKELQKTKSGIFTGATARNPVTGEAIPVWVADYVLGRCATLIYFPMLSVSFLELALIGQLVTRRLGLSLQHSYRVC